MSERLKFTDRELLYAATARCRCGDGLAYPLDHELSMKIRAWVCAAVLRGDVAGQATGRDAFSAPDPNAEHDAFHWSFWKIREETSINNTGSHTTRPAGTVARTVGKATCPCGYAWESEPYDAPSPRPDGRSHWMSGPCPKCGLANGGSCSTKMSEPYIEKRYRDVVLEIASEPT